MAAAGNTRAVTIKRPRGVGSAAKKNGNPAKIRSREAASSGQEAAADGEHWEPDLSKAARHLKLDRADLSKFCKETGYEKQPQGFECTALLKAYREAHPCREDLYALESHDPKVRLVAAKAAIEEEKLRRMRGETVDAASVAEEWLSMIEAFNQELEKMERELPSIVEGMDAGQIHALIRERNNLIRERMRARVSTSDA